MKKFNLSNIMKRAWELVKKFGRTMSAALKTAWAEAKKESEKIAFSGKEMIDGFQFVAWEKYGKKRIYINNYTGSNRKNSGGYIDVTTGAIVATGCVKDAAERFMSTYRF